MLYILGCTAFLAAQTIPRLTLAENHAREEVARHRGIGDWIAAGLGATREEMPSNTPTWRVSKPFPNATYTATISSASQIQSGPPGLGDDDEWPTSTGSVVPLLASSNVASATSLAGSQGNGSGPLLTTPAHRIPSNASTSHTSSLNLTTIVDVQHSEEWAVETPASRFESHGSVAKNATAATRTSTMTSVLPLGSGFVLHSTQNVSATAARLTVVTSFPSLNEIFNSSRGRTNETYVSDCWDAWQIYSAANPSDVVLYYPGYNSISEIIWTSASSWLRPPADYKPTQVETVFPADDCRYIFGAEHFIGTSCYTIMKTSYEAPSTSIWTTSYTTITSTIFEETYTSTFVPTMTPPTCSLPSSVPQCQSSWMNYLTDAIQSMPTQASGCQASVTVPWDGNVPLGPQAAEQALCFQEHLSSVSAWGSTAWVTPPKCTQASLDADSDMCTSMKEQYERGQNPNFRQEDGSNLSDMVFAPGCTMGCGKCFVTADTIQLIYFPPGLSHTATGPVTLSTHGTVLTSPTVYISMSSVHAQDLCGAVGPTVTSQLVAVTDPGEMKSLYGMTVFSNDFDIYNTPAMVGIFTASFNITDVYATSLPYSVYASQPWCKTWEYVQLQDQGSIMQCPTQQPYEPIIVLPTYLWQNLNSEWTTCALDNRGVYDPPVALHPTDAIAVPTMPGVPAATLASPGQVTSQPSQTAANIDSFGLGDGGGMSSESSAVKLSHFMPTFGLSGGVVFNPARPTHIKPAQIMSRSGLSQPLSSTVGMLIMPDRPSMSSEFDPDETSGEPDVPPLPQPASRPISITPNTWIEEPKAVFTFLLGSALPTSTSIPNRVVSISPVNLGADEDPSRVVINGIATLTDGQSPKVIDGMTMSFNAVAGVVAVEDGAGLSTAVSVPPAPIAIELHDEEYSIGGQSFSTDDKTWTIQRDPNDPTALIIDNAITVYQGDEATSIAGHEIQYLENGSGIIVDTSITFALPAATSTGFAYPLGDQIFKVANSLDRKHLIIDGSTTLTLNGPEVAYHGHTLSFGSGGLIVDGATTVPLLSRKAHATVTSPSSNTFTSWTTNTRTSDDEPSPNTVTVSPATVEQGVGRVAQHTSANGTHQESGVSKVEAGLYFLPVLVILVVLNGLVMTP